MAKKLIKKVVKKTIKKATTQSPKQTFDDFLKTKGEKTLSDFIKFVKENHPELKDRSSSMKKAHEYKKQYEAIYKEPIKNETQSTPDEKEPENKPVMNLGPEAEPEPEPEVKTSPENNHPIDMYGIDKEKAIEKIQQAKKINVKLSIHVDKHIRANYEGSMNHIQHVCSQHLPKGGYEIIKAGKDGVNTLVYIQAGDTRIPLHEHDFYTVFLVD